MVYLSRTENHCVLAVDIGGPIVRQKGTPTEDAIDALHLLSISRFGARVHLISRCDEATEASRREWLARHEFYRRSRVSSKNVHFCRELWQKAQICTKLGVTHFVENSIATLRRVTSVPNLYLYHPDREEAARHPDFMRYVFDPKTHSAPEENSRPIFLMTEWNLAALERILTDPIFRCLANPSLPEPAFCS